MNCNRLLDLVLVLCIMFLGCVAVGYAFVLRDTRRDLVETRGRLRIVELRIDGLQVLLNHTRSEQVKDELSPLRIVLESDPIPDYGSVQ